MTSENTDRQLTTDALARLLGDRITSVEAQVQYAREEQRADHKNVREDISQLREIAIQSLTATREANGTARSAFALAEANAQAIESLQERNRDQDIVLAVLPEGGGLRGLVARVVGLTQKHETATLEETFEDARKRRNDEAWKRRRSRLEIVAIIGAALSGLVGGLAGLWTLISKGFP